MNWLKRFFCKHQWVTQFRGKYTRVVECAYCGKVDLLEDINDGTEPVGWRDGL